MQGTVDWVSSRSVEVDVGRDHTFKRGDEIELRRIDVKPPHAWPAPTAQDREGINGRYYEGEVIALAGTNDNRGFIHGSVEQHRFLLDFWNDY